MNIVIPAAGVGSRFVTAGYTMPKPFLPIKGKAMLEWVIDNVASPDDKVFVLMRTAMMHYLQGTGLAVRAGLCFIPIDQPTEGAACTVLKARPFIDNDEPLLIANSDQYMVYDRKQWDYWRLNSDGAIMTFESDEPKWSYAEVDFSNRVTKVAEKQVISNHATCGVYHFKSGKLFCSAADQMIKKKIKVKGEFYLCPVFNELVNSSTIYIFDVEKMYGLGTPEDFQANSGFVGT